MGTSRTFDLEPDENLGQLMEVLEAFFISGGTVIDSSPMYGNAESTIGTLLSQMSFPHRYFAATKVWTTQPDIRVSEVALVEDSPEEIDGTQEQEIMSLGSRLSDVFTQLQRHTSLLRIIR